MGKRSRQKRERRLAARHNPEGHMGKIVITVDGQGRMGLQSDFDQGTTLLLLEKVVKTVVDQPVNLPQTVQAAPAAVLDRLNGHRPH